MNKKQSGEFITASIFHSPPLLQPEWPSDFPSALLALVSVSPHAALGRAPASLPQLHVPPTSELVLRVRVQPKRVQCILRSTCAPFIILSPQASPCPLLYSRVSVHCSVTCVSASFSLLRVVSLRTKVTAGSQRQVCPLCHITVGAHGSAVPWHWKETGPSSRAVSIAAVHQLLQRSCVVSSFSAGSCSWLKPRQSRVGGVIDPLEASRA